MVDLDTFAETSWAREPPPPGKRPYCGMGWPPHSKKNYNYCQWCHVVEMEDCYGLNYLEINDWQTSEADDSESTHAYMCMI